MSFEPFNSLGGFSVSIPAVAVIDSSGNVVSNVVTTGNVTAGNITAAAFYYSNGAALANAGGANTQIQFNNQGTFGASSTLTFDSSTNLLSVPNFISSGVVSLGPASSVEITGGSPGYLLQTDGSGSLSWVAGPSGNGLPGGSNSQIQFNSDGAFGGSSAMSFDKDSGTVAFTEHFIANTIQVGYGTFKFCTSLVYTATTVGTSPQQPLYSIPTANVGGVDFHIIATDATNVSRQIAKISSIVLNDIVQYNEYAGLYINGGVGDFEVIFDLGHLILVVTPDRANFMTYRMLISVYNGA